MGLKIFTIDHSILATSKHCRLDEKYASFTSIDNWIVFESQKVQEPLSYFIEELPIVKIKKGELEEEMLLINISDQTQRSGELENIEGVTEIGSDKNDLSNADLLISKLGMPRGYIFLNSFKGNRIIGSTEFIPYKLKENTNMIILKYLLLHPKMLNAYTFLESGKTPSHKRVNPYELKNIRIPVLEKTKEDQIVPQLLTIERKIKKLKEYLIQPQAIINKIFAREFKFDIREVEKIEKKRYFSIKNDITYRNRNLRTSLRWNKINPIQAELYRNISNVQKLGKFIVATKNGWSPNCRESDNKYTVFGVNSISKDGYIKFLDLKYSDETKKDISKFFVKENDLFVSRGNTVDLVAMASVVKDLPDDQDFIFPDLFIRIELDTGKLKKEYIAFLFNSIIGRYYFKYSSKGKNQTMVKISSEELNNFFIPVPSIKRQKELIDEINFELKKQEKTMHKINEERKKIDLLIEGILG